MEFHILLKNMLVKTFIICQYIFFHFVLFFKYNAVLYLAGQDVEHFFLSVS